MHCTELATAEVAAYNTDSPVYLLSSQTVKLQLFIFDLLLATFFNVLFDLDRIRIKCSVLGSEVQW